MFSIWVTVFHLLIPPALAEKPANWPPVTNQEFPNIKMFDADGKDVELKSLKGTTLIVEPVAMTCSGCQAFSGGHKHGGFGKIQPQPGLKSFEEYFKSYSGGIELNDKRIKFVQIIFYDMQVKPPTKDDVALWRKHFKMNSVYGAKKEFIDNYSFAMIPGFFLIDKNFKLIADSTGHNPKVNLYTFLIPETKKYLTEKTP